MATAIMATSRVKLAVFGAIGVLVLIVAGLGILLATRHQAPGTLANGTVAISISDIACTPDAVTVAAGTPSFSISNSPNGKSSTASWCSPSAKTSCPAPRST